MAKDHKSFDILWFDLSTKCRELFVELNQPLVDKIYKQDAEVDQIKKQVDTQLDQIQVLENIVNN